MSQSVAAQIELGENPFRQYFIPSESEWVCYVMQKAAEFSRSSNPILSRAQSVACAVAAITLSVFNTFTYFFQAPFRILVNVIQFNPKNLVMNFVGDLTNGMLSFVFVSLGPTFIVAGLLMPAPVFTNFAPEKALSQETVIELQRETIVALNNEKQELRNRLNKMSEIFAKQEKEIEDLKRPKTSSSWFRFPLR